MGSCFPSPWCPSESHFVLFELPPGVIHFIPLILITFLCQLSLGMGLAHRMQEVWSAIVEAVPLLWLVGGCLYPNFSWLLAASKWQFYLAAMFVITGGKKISEAF